MLFYYDSRDTCSLNSLIVYFPFLRRAWDLFMDDGFKGLRELICPTLDDLGRFRQLVVNTVMATDIVNKELKNLRNRYVTCAK